MKRKRAERLAVAAVLMALAGAPLVAQEAEGPADPYVSNHNLKGVVPFGSFQFGSLDAVNLATGGLEVTIPLGSRAGRGLDAARALTYSSKVWNAQRAEIVPGVEEVHMLMTSSENRDFRERRSLGELQWLEDFEVPCPVPMETGLLRVRSNFVYRSAQGGTFRFANRVVLVESGVCTQTDIYEVAIGTSDSGVMLLETPSEPFSQAPFYTLRFKDGSIELFDSASGVAVKRKDSNGNFLGDGMDTLGRSLSGDFRDSQGNPVSYVLTRQQTPVDPSFPSTACGPDPIVAIPPGGGSFLALHRIDLPNGLNYQFEYDPQFGELTKIVLPSGGYIRYEYATLPAFDQASEEVGCPVDSRRVSLRALSEDGTAASEDVWSYDYSINGIGQYVTTVTDPEGNVRRRTFDQDGIHLRISEVLDASGQVLRRETHMWETSFQPVQSSQVLATDPELFQLFAERNWRIVQTDSEWVQEGLVSRQTVQYDSYAPPDPTSTEADTRMNVKAEETFDWGEGGPGPLLRRMEFDYLHEGSPSYEAAHIWDRAVLETVSDQEGIAAQTRTLYDNTALTFSTAIQHEDPGTLRGNPTAVERWLNTESRWVASQNFFDRQGNLVRRVDPEGNQTLFGYADDWEPSPACPPPGQARAFATSTANALGHAVSRSFFSCSSLTESVTDANGRSASFAYDLFGRLKRADSPDGGEHVRFYSDVASDLTAQRSGQPVFRDAGALPLRSKSFTLIESGLDQAELTVLDGLGRIEFQGRKNGQQFGLPRFDCVMTEYDGNGRLASTSNPLSLADASDIPDPLSFSAKTRTFYDELDRAVEVETPDGQNAFTAYSGNQSTVTDQAGASRRSKTDALGRIVEVREPDPATGSLDSGDFSDTLYGYDPLGNLTGVLQGPGGSDQDGSGGDGITQSRSFLYDTLGRLIQESHPESGTARYGYDDNGNLEFKVDARGRRTDNGYDALNRIRSTSYSVDGDPSRSDPTPAVSYFYDGSTALNRRGRLRSVTDGAGTSSFEYDAMGRTVRSVRTTRGKTLTAGYSYTLLGGVKTASYQGVSPAGYTLVYGYDGQGRQVSLSDGGGTPFVTGYRFEHHSSSSLEQTFYGNGVEESISYNNRLQPTARTVFDSSFNVLMDLRYDYLDFFNEGNNGNVTGIDDLVSGESRIFLYDRLNRLRSVGGMPWGIDYAYDRFGNRLSAVGTASTPNFQSAVLTIDPSTNRIADPGWEHDAAGNVIEDGGAHHYRWDSAGRLIEMAPPQPSTSDPPGDDGRCSGPECPNPPPPPPDPDPPLDNGRSSGGFKSQSAGTVSYEYDYQGRRVVKDEGGTGRLYFWDEVLGEVIWEFPLEAPASQDVVRGFLNGRLVVENDTRPGGGLHYFHRDHLGTSKLMTDFFSGGAVCDETYHPFGQLQSEQPSGCNAHVRKFTGKERDPESGLDYFGARYCDIVTGRFISVDPVRDSVDLDNPQTWNRYSYVRNSPLGFVDPDGRQVISRRDLERRIQAANDFIDSIPLLPGSFKAALKFLFVPGTPDEAALSSLPFPGGMGMGIASGGARRLSLLRKVRIATQSENIGTQLEGIVARRFRDSLVSFQEEIRNAVGRRLGEIDVELEKAIIEVTTDSTGKFKQALKLLAGELNPSEKTVVIFGPKLKARAAKQLEEAGVRVFRTLDELEKFVSNLQ